MSKGAWLFAGFLGLATVRTDAGAQRMDSLATPANAQLACASSGFTARAWSDGADPSVPTRSPALAPNVRAGTMDTTIVLAIVDRRWQRDNVNAGVALGGGGIVPAHGAWNACAGASVHLDRVTAQLHNVAGSIHFRADLSALDSIGRTRSSIPPASPPRR